jgi:hypothetical protein
VGQVCAIVQNTRKLPRLEGKHFSLEDESIAGHIGLSCKCRVVVFADVIPSKESALLAFE